MNPVQLQTFFRTQAPTVLHQLQQQTDGDLQLAEFSEHYSNIMTPNDLIDSSILNYIWPNDFNNYRICVISFNSATNATPTSITVYTPANNDDAWNGHDVLLRLYKRHFTLITLTGESTVLPIDRLITYASDNNIFCESRHIQNSQGTLHNTLFQTLNVNNNNDEIV